MEWIEKVSGFSPDGGDGSIELAIGLTVIAVLLIMAFGVWQVTELRRRSV